MPIVTKDKVRSSTSTTGTGTYTLGSADTGFLNFSVIGNGNQTYYCCTNGTDWEIGLGTYTSSGTTLSRDTILSSSNNGNAINWTSGAKDIFVTFPAEYSTPGLVNFDNNSIGSDLIGWGNFKKYLDLAVQNSVPYDNQGVGGIVSTYSLVYTGSFSYAGGVLTPDGDIHFIPVNANRGQKINTITGVVSTYSLVYTFGSGNYIGGVLAPNGDIHFVPYLARVGQKINTITGVVSTYALVYTTSGAYYGGVLAPNGDIHFIPVQVNRGQKINTITGVVSTYSLAYTAGVYAGGVLAPNGDIHFVPNLANRGQKINTITGIVSTYSLGYTAYGGYAGGVLAPNGDIHFVPTNANRGQKISTNTSLPLAVFASPFFNKF